MERGVNAAWPAGEATVFPVKCLRTHDAIECGARRAVYSSIGLHVVFAARRSSIGTEQRAGPPRSSRAQGVTLCVQQLRARAGEELDGGGKLAQNTNTRRCGMQHSLAPPATPHLVSPRASPCASAAAAARISVLGRHAATVRHDNIRGGRPRGDGDGRFVLAALTAIARAARHGPRRRAPWGIEP